MNLKTMILAGVCVLTTSTAVWAQSNNGASDQSLSQSQTSAFMQWQAQRDAVAKQRLGGATAAPGAKADAVQAMWNAPVKTEDAVPTESSSDQQADSNSH